MSDFGEFSAPAYRYDQARPGDLPVLEDLVIGNDCDVVLSDAPEIAFDTRDIGSEDVVAEASEDRYEMSSYIETSGLEGEYGDYSYTESSLGVLPDYDYDAEEIQTTPDVPEPFLESFNDIVKEYYTGEEEFRGHRYQVSPVIDDHLEEILDELPCMAALPMPDELDELAVITRVCPMIIEEPITVADLQGHLAAADSDTREINIQTLKDGTQMIEVGVVRSVSPENSLTFGAHTIGDLHTHPPADIFSIMPSQTDVVSAYFRGRPIYVASRDGLTYVPKPEQNVEGCLTPDRWNDFLTRHGIESRPLHIDDVLYYQFSRETIEEVIRPQFIPWDELDSTATLADIFSGGIESCRKRLTT